MRPQAGEARVLGAKAAGTNLDGNRGNRRGLVLELSDDLIALQTNPLDGVLVEAGNSLTAVV
jgi:hypothetical protein